MNKNCLFFILIIFTGCSPLGPLATTGTIPVAGQIDMLTLIGTEKTIVDHVISLSSGKDCSAVNIEKEQYYCDEDEPAIKQNIFCYPSLGNVTCYDKPIEGYQQIGQNQHNLVKPVPANRP